MLRIGNLFELAETKLLMENRDYSSTDIIDYASRIRSWLDENEGNIEQWKVQLKKEKIRQCRRSYWLKYRK